MKSTHVSVAFSSNTIKNQLHNHFLGKDA